MVIGSTQGRATPEGEAGTTPRYPDGGEYDVSLTIFPGRYLRLQKNCSDGSLSLSGADSLTVFAFGYLLSKKHLSATWRCWRHPRIPSGVFNGK